MKVNRILLCLCGAILLASLGGCVGSQQMSTAKLAIRNGNFDKAVTALKEEVALRPDNAEAWYLLGTIYSQQERYTEMADAYEKALAPTGEKALKPEFAQAIPIDIYNAWYKSFRGSQQAIEGNQLAEARSMIETAMMLRPDYPGNFYNLAAIEGRLGNDEAQLAAYREYVDLVQPNVVLGTSRGLALGMTPSEVEAKLGKAKVRVRQDNRGMWAPTEDPAGPFTAIYDDEFYVYFGPVGNSTRIGVSGWRSYKGSDMAEDLRPVDYPISSYPHYRLAYDAYQQKRYDEAIQLLTLVQQLEPEREETDDLAAQTYIEAKRVPEARQLLEKRIQASPNDVRLYNTYAALLQSEGLEDFQAATDILKRAIALNVPKDDRHYRTALYNLGAIYKNWGKKLQDSILDVSNDNPSAAQRAAYEAPLKESVRAFEQLRDLQGDKVDFMVYAELGNLYQVLGQDADFKRSIQLLEGLEKDPEIAANGDYWRQLSIMYTIMGNEQKAVSALARAKELGN